MTSTVATPKITALVSTYNAERFICGCLEDLVAQTVFDQMEVIVIDSASPQKEGSIVEEFQRFHPQIRYVRTSERETLYAAWNRGILMARGEYLTNANTDDRHAPCALEKLARALDKNPTAGVAYGGTDITTVENGSFATAPRSGHFKARAFDRKRLFYDCLPGPQPMWRRNLHERFGLFDPAFRSAGDYEFWLRISQEVKFVHVSETLGLFLNSPASLSNTKEISDRETELARNRHWPAEWGTRPKHHRSFFDQLFRRSTYRTLFAAIIGRFSRGLKQ